MKQMIMDIKGIYVKPVIEIVEIGIDDSIMKSSFGVSDTNVGEDEEIRSKRRDFWNNER